MILGLPGRYFSIVWEIMLPCPRCHAALSLVHGTQGSHYECPECGGRLANLSMLRRSVDPGVIQSLWNTVSNAPVATHHAAVPCPTCSDSMHCAGVGEGESEVQVDVCRHCRMIWLDPGEMELLPAAESPREPAGQYDELPPEALWEMRSIIAEREIAKIQREEIDCVDDEDESLRGTLRFVQRTLLLLFGFRPG